MKSMFKVVAVMLAAGLLPWAAQADERFREHEHDREHYEFLRHAHGFEAIDIDLWVRGTWVQGWFNGQYGWWWISAGRRYFYTQPVYPYPVVMSEVWYPEVPVMQAPPPVVVTTPPPPPGVAPPPPSGFGPPPPQPQTWYYCDNPAGYYPYVQVCAQPFRAVQAH